MRRKEAWARNQCRSAHPTATPRFGAIRRPLSGRWRPRDLSWACAFLNCCRDRQSYAASEWATLSSKSLCHLCFINASPVTRSPAPLPPLNELPTVDALVPSYNESPAILEATLLAALQMRYPEEKRKVYLCDDGGTDQKCSTGTPEAQAAARERRQELTELCAKLGAYYLTRPKPKVLVSGHLRRGVVRRFPGDGRDRRACACFSKILPRFRSWPARIKENLCNFWNR